MATSSGDTIGRYSKVRWLGNGTSGNAWLVECTKDEVLPSGAPLKKGQQLVAKLVSIKGATTDEIDKAKAEAHFLESLIHPRIITHVEHFTAPGYLFVIVIEYAPGGSVGDRIKTAAGPLQALPEAVAMHVACQVCVLTKYTMT
jgi:serine/threonine protein kinase